MKKELLGISTLVYLDVLKKGIKQETILDTIQTTGLNTVEIKREFMQNPQKEIEGIRSIAEKKQLGLLYHTGGKLYENGELQYKKLEQYVQEAFLMGCQRIILNLGQCSLVKEVDVIKVNELCTKYFIRLSIENDQSREGGKREKLLKFIEEYRSLGGKITLTFHMGNWIWQGEDPLENARILNGMISCVKLNDVIGKINPQQTFLNQGDLQINALISLLPKNIPFIIDYACGENPQVQIIKEIEKIPAY